MAKTRPTSRETEAAAIRPGPMIVDLNFLPDRYRGRGLRILVSLRPWFFLAGFALLLIPSAKLYLRQSAELAAADAKLAAVSEETEAYQPLADERALLEVRILSAEAQIVEISAAYDTINIQRVTWSEVVPLILAQVPAGVDLTLLSQSEEEVVLMGFADAYALPSILADKLEALDPFESVIIQSIVLVELRVEPEHTEEEPPTAIAGEAPLAEIDPATGQPASGGEGATADEPPSDLTGAEAASGALLIGIESEQPPRYQFEISIYLPSFVEPTPELIDEN